MEPVGHHPHAGLVCVLLLTWALCATARAVDFAGGTGEPNDPYQIATAEQLVAMGSDPALYTKCFVLVSDIDLDPNLPGGCVFHEAVIAPDVDRPEAIDPNFTGTFDGQGFKVFNMTVAAREQGGDLLALFGRIGPGARVCNLGVENALVRGEPNSSNVAALVGANAGKVWACYVGGSVSGGAKVGGLCGENWGMIQSCYSTASVSGDAQVGGLVGYNHGLGVPSGRSRRAEDINYTGGIVNCYSAGVVSGRESVGGFVGVEDGLTSHCFWDISTSGLSVSDAGYGLTGSRMMDAAIFAVYGWDHDPNWVMADGEDYPRLAWEMTNGGRIEGSVSDWFEESGTAQDPWRIATAEQFALLGLVPRLDSKHFVLQADLDLAGLYLHPILLRGCSFHGNGHVLHNALLRTGRTSSMGLFGYIDATSRVSNLGLENITVVVGPQSSAVGTLAATNEGVITGCYATGVIRTDQGTRVGGLVGSNSGRIAYSYARVPITGALSSGSLAGDQTFSGLVGECYAVGGTTDSEGGGLTGGNLGAVVNSYFLQRSEAPLASAQGFALSDAEMRQRESFLGWDFVGSASDGPLDRWSMLDANYPVLSWQADLQGLRPIPDIGNMPLEWATAELELAGFVVGEIRYNYHSVVPKEWAIVTSPLGLAPAGSVVDLVLSQGRFMRYDVDYSPALIRIETPGQVECLVGAISGNSNFLLTRDIDMAGWEVLGSRASDSYSNVRFAGTFLGNGHKISNLKIFRNVGFFDQIAPEGLVHGLGLENILVADSARTSLGGLASQNDGTILDCHVTGVVEGSGDTRDLGGLVGVNRGLISECFAASTVRGQPNVSDTEAELTALPARGGLVAVNASTITDSYAKGDVSGNGYVGGLVGDNVGPITRCYAATCVTREGLENIGGLVGRNGVTYSRARSGGGQPVPISVMDCYFLSSASGGGPDNGVGIALTDAGMKQQASFAGWDFENVWIICEGEDYPRLRWEGVECGSER